MAIYNASGQQVIQRGKSVVAEPAWTPTVADIHMDTEWGLQNPYAFRQISYPRDITTNPERGHYMLFYVNVQEKSKYLYKVGKEGVLVGNTVSTFVKGEAAGRDEGGRYEATVDHTEFTSAEGAYKYNFVKKGGIGSLGTGDAHFLAKGRAEGDMATHGLQKWMPTTKRISDSIAIYLPANINSRLDAGYDDAVMGMLGFGLASGFDFAKKWNEDDFEGGARALKKFVGTMGKDIFQRALAGIADTIVGGGEGNTYGAVNKAFGRATNPYMEVIFNKMAVRSFRYNFTFQPRSPEETDDVQEIIKLFRFHMAPELQEGNMRFMGLPSTFDIHYMYQTASANESGNMDWRNAKENSYYNKIATCVLESVSVDYTPEGVRSFADGAPTQIKMELSFKETELLTKDKINKGF